MKSVKKRDRYVFGKTDYGHRYKMLKNRKLFRIYLMKKNKYYCVGFYVTESPDKADRCYNYYESRWFRTRSEDRPLRNNQHDLKLFGKVVGVELNNLHLKVDLAQKVLVLDLGRRKHLCYKNFLEGLFSTLDPQLKEKFKISDSLRDELSQVPQDTPYFFKKRNYDVRTES